MSRFTELTVVTGHEIGPEVHNTSVSVVDAALHARSVLSPRVDNNPLIDGFAGSGGKRHLDRLTKLVSLGQGSLAMMADGVSTAGVTTVSMPQALHDNVGNLKHYGLFVDSFYIGPNRSSKLVEGFAKGIEMAQNMLGLTIEIERVSLKTGRTLKPEVVTIPNECPIYVLEPSPDSEVTNKRGLLNFLGSNDNPAEIRAVRAEANDAVVEAGFTWIEEADLSREGFMRQHRHGRYALYQFLG